MTDSVDHFHRQARAWHQHYTKPHFRDRLSVFLSELRRVLPPPRSLLDFGCGPGVMAMECARSGYAVMAVDAAPGMVEATQHARDQAQIPNLTCGLVSSLPSARSFDAVVCSSVLEYVEDDRAVVSRLAAHLRPRGYLLVSVPHTASWVGRAEDLARHLGRPRRREPAGHDAAFARRRYSRAAILGLLSQYDLALDRITYYELPRLGRLGIAASRLPCLGVMMLVVARKGSGRSSDGANLPAAPITAGHVPVSNGPR